MTKEKQTKANKKQSTNKKPSIPNIDVLVRKQIQIAIKHPNEHNF